MIDHPEKPIFIEKSQKTENESNLNYETPVIKKAKTANIEKLNEDNLEVPTFIHKNDKVYPHNHPDTFQNQMKNDLNLFISQFDNSHDKNERIKICKLFLNLVKDGTSRLDIETQQLTSDIHNELNDLLFAKEYLCNNLF